MTMAPFSQITLHDDHLCRVSLVAEVASRIGVSQHSLYEWLKRYSLPPVERSELQGQSAEIRRLKAELKRVSEERDILKKDAAYFAKESR